MSSAQTITVNGARLHVEDLGEGAPIVLVHSGITDCRMWDPQFQTYSRRHRTVRYDMRGYGRSTIPPEPFAHHDDLLGIFEHLDLHQAVLIGASYGGDVATSFALDHPDRTRALVLVNTLAGLDEPSDSLRNGWRAVNAAMDEGDVAGAVEIETQMWVDGPHRGPSQVNPEFRARVTSMNAAIFARMDEIEAAEERELDPPLIERLSSITVPTLIIVGELDQPDAMTSATRLASSLPNARLEAIPDAAHLPSMERPDTFDRLVTEFITALV